MVEQLLNSFFTFHTTNFQLENTSKQQYNNLCRNAVSLLKGIRNNAPYVVLKIDVFLKTILYVNKEILKKTWFFSRIRKKKTGNETV